MLRPYANPGNPSTVESVKHHTPSPLWSAVMTRYLAAAALALLVLPISSLHAQESDDEWLSNCREGWGDWGSRARHCEIRETGMKATGRPLRSEEHTSELQ